LDSVFSTTVSICFLDGGVRASVPTSLGRFFDASSVLEPVLSTVWSLEGGLNGHELTFWFQNVPKTHFSCQQTDIYITTTKRTRMKRRKEKRFHQRKSDTASWSGYARIGTCGWRGRVSVRPPAYSVWMQWLSVSCELWKHAPYPQKKRAAKRNLLINCWMVFVSICWNRFGTLNKKDLWPFIVDAIHPKKQKHTHTFVNTCVSWCPETKMEETHTHASHKRDKQIPLRRFPWKDPNKNRSVLG